MTSDEIMTILSDIESDRIEKTTSTKKEEKKEAS